ncbi:MAG: glycosyltransferase family 1 protein [Planctomycetota bacterium]|nr:glycosyltransferase family 1 protein [Planctomycetota bacterium]
MEEAEVSALGLIQPFAGSLRALRRQHRRLLNGSRYHFGRVLCGVIQRFAQRCVPVGVSGSWDVVHCLHAIPSVAQVGGLPRLVTLHDLIPTALPEYCDPGYVAGWREALLGLDPERDMVACISEATRQDLTASGLFDSDRIHVVPNGIGSQFVAREASEVASVCERYGCVSGQYLLTLATREPRKNLALSVEVFQELASRNPALRLVLVGGDNGLGEELSIAEEIRHRVVMTGYLDDQDLPNLLTGCAAFLFPSWYEGFGLPPLEALACGAPVVVSDRGALPEVVGSFAEAVDPSDVGAWVVAVERAMCDGARNGGVSHARSFSWEHSYAKYRDLYRAFLTA